MRFPRLILMVFLVALIGMGTFCDVYSYKESDLKKLLRTGKCVFCDLSTVSLAGYDLSGVNLMGANLTGAKLMYANLSGANLSSANLIGSKLFWANLESVNLNYGRLRSADLDNVNLTGADLSYSDFSSSSLRYAIIYIANLVGAKLINADLTYAILRDSYLYSAYLNNSVLRGADLTGAVLKDVDLTGAKTKLAIFDGHRNDTKMKDILAWREKWKRERKGMGKLYIGKPRIKKQTPRKEEARRRYKQKKLYRASSGTGFFVSKAGHVVTNNHVIRYCNNVQIHREGRGFSTSVIATDQVNDLALLKTSYVPKDVLSFRSSGPTLLEPLYVAGYPFGRQMGMSSSLKVSRGIVSALSGLGDNYSQFQTDAAVNPGNSGGPITDSKGNVIGVAVSKLKKIKRKNDMQVPEGINFGVKTSSVLNLLSGKSVSYKRASRRRVTTKELGLKLTKATTYISCWMTKARYQRVRAKKVLFENVLK